MERYNELKHFGVKGMKWGVRKSDPKKQSADHKEVAVLRKKKLSEMSNNELKTLTARLELERKYSDLVVKPNKAITRGKNMMEYFALANNILGVANNAANIGSSPAVRLIRNQFK